MGISVKFFSVRLIRYKAQNFWEQTCQDIEDDEFRRYFRMNRETLKSLTKFLNPRRRIYQGGRKQVEPEKMVAMTCCFLGSQLPYKQLAGIFGVTEACFICCTDYIMKLLQDKVNVIIKWPSKDDYPNIAAEFNKGKFR